MSTHYRSHTRFDFIVSCLESNVALESWSNRSKYKQTSTSRLLKCIYFLSHNLSCALQKYKARLNYHYQNRHIFKDLRLHI